MSLALQFKLTQVGQASVWNATHTGTALNLTHIQFGSGNRQPSGTETALLIPKQTAAIAAGFSVSPTQIRMSAIFSGEQNYMIREVGLWAGDPTHAGAKLVGYWSQADGDLASKSPSVDFIFSHDMVLDTAVPAGSLTIIADNTQSAMLAMLTAHEAAPNPHPQYATKAAIQNQTYTTLITSGSAPDFTASVSPKLSAYLPGQRFRVKFDTLGTGSDTLNINGVGRKNLKQYDYLGSKVAAIIPVNQFIDIEYDGIDFVLLEALPASAHYLTDSSDFSTAFLAGTANTLYTPEISKAKGLYLIVPYSLGWHFTNVGGSYFMTAFADFISGNGSATSINLETAGPPYGHRAPFLLRITSPTASFKLCLKNNGSIPPGQGTITITAGVNGVAFNGYRIG